MVVRTGFKQHTADYIQDITGSDEDEWVPQVQIKCFYLENPSQASNDLIFFFKVSFYTYITGNKSCISFI